MWLLADDLEFHDAVETEEDLETLMQCQDPKANTRMKELQRKMADILKKRAQLRNRSVRFQTKLANLFAIFSIYIYML